MSMYRMQRRESDLQSNNTKPDLFCAVIFQEAVIVGPCILYAVLCPQQINIVGPVLAGILIAISMTVYRRLSWKYRFLIPIIWLVILAGGMLLFHSQMTDGVADLINRITELWKQEYGRNYTIYASTAEEWNAWLAMTGLTAVWAVIYEISEGKPIVLILPYLGYCILGLFCIHTTNIWFWVLLAMHLLLCIEMIMESKTKGLSEKKFRTIGQTWIRLSVVIGVLLAATAGFWESRDVPGKESLQSFLADSIHQMRYKTAAGTGLTEGRLENVGNREYSEDIILKVTMTQPTSYYLRGFVGESYENNTWKPLAAQTRYEYADTFYWLHQDGFYGQSQLTTAAKAVDSEQIAYENTVTIQNVALPSDVVYAPYELLQESDILDAQLIGDSSIPASGFRGMREYTWQASDNIVTQYRKIAALLSQSETKETQDYLASEAAYNQFVYQNYTELPSDILQYLSGELGEYIVDSGQAHMDYQMAKQNVLYYLTTEMTYQEEVSPVGKDVDFILQFLDGTKKGYDIHYASAAVMLFRYYGIPARYVEGVLITPEEVKTMADGDTLLLDGSHVHAWVEYYQDGVGWIPFEVTPTYLSVMESSEQYQDISGLTGQVSGEEQVEENIEPDSNSDTETKPLMTFWLENKLQIILGSVIVIAFIVLALFSLWLVSERRRVAKRKENFLKNTPTEAICDMYIYAMELLQATGLRIQNCPPESYQQAVESDMRQGYTDVVKIWKEARFSQHAMSEEQRTVVFQFQEELWKRIWKQSNMFMKLKIKYMLFL